MPARRVAAVVVGVLALVGGAACSDDDGGGFPGSLAADAEDGDGERAGACALLEAAELEAATGQPFQTGQPSDGTCTYLAEDGRATVTVNVTELPPGADLALETTSSTCDEGSVVDVDVPGSTGAFACTVSGVAVVAGTSAGTYVVVAGAALGDPATPAAAFPALGDVLTRVLEEAG